MPFPGFGAAFQSQGGWPGQQQGQAQGGGYMGPGQMSFGGGAPGGQLGGLDGGGLPPWMQGGRQPQGFPGAGPMQHPNFGPQGGGWNGQPGMGAGGQGGNAGSGALPPWLHGGAMQPGGFPGAYPMQQLNPGGMAPAPMPFPGGPDSPMSSGGREPGISMAMGGSGQPGSPGFPTQLSNMVATGQISAQDAIARAQANHPEWAQQQPGYQQPMGARLSPMQGGGGQSPPIFAGGGDQKQPSYQGGSMDQNKGPRPDMRFPTKPQQPPGGGQWRGAGKPQPQAPSPYQMVTAPPVSQPMPGPQPPQQLGGGGMPFQRDQRFGGVADQYRGSGGGHVLGGQTVSIDPNDPRYAR